MRSVGRATCTRPDTIVVGRLGREFTPRSRTGLRNGPIVEACLFNAEYRSHATELLAAFGNDFAELAQAIRADMVEAEHILRTQHPYSTQYSRLTRPQLEELARQEHAKDCLLSTAADILSKLTERVSHNIAQRENTAGRGALHGDSCQVVAGTITCENALRRVLTARKRQHTDAIRRINDAIRKLVPIYNDTRRFCSPEVAAEYSQLTANDVVREQDPSKFFFYALDPMPDRNARWRYVVAYCSILRLEEEKALLCQGHESRAGRGRG